MNDEQLTKELTAARVSIKALWQCVLDLRADRNAMGTIMASILDLPSIPDDIKELIASYSAVRENCRVRDSLNIEKVSPSIAAELDAEWGPKPPEL